ncbi:MAG: protein translocase subunit SecD [bacterium]|nr:protein translocase subunit SecD [bacterium]
MNWRAILLILSIVLFGSIIAWRGVKLGLDLRGGSYFLLNVRTDLASQNYVEKLASDILSKFRERYGTEITDPVLVQGERVYVKYITDFIDFVKKEFPSFEYASLDYVDGISYSIFSLNQNEKKEIEDLAVTQALQVIISRIDEFGVAEPQIFKFGRSRIVVQLPGVTDPERAKQLIGRTALLEFRILDDQADYFVNVNPPEGIYKSTEIGSGGNQISYFWAYEKDLEKLSNFVQTLTPYSQGRLILLGRDEREGIFRTYALSPVAELTGAYLKDARVRMNSITNEPYVLLAFNSEGARIFENLTSQNVGRRLAIVLEQKVFSAPVIRERIGGGVASIEGRFTIEDARELAAVLRAGALPAPVEFEEERTVGPSLGEDSIRKGLIASAIGASATALFMIFYYKISGLVAMFGVLIALLFIFGMLSIFGATLTLPGIAAIALTVGMTVDNNIIIFERIREELLKRFSIKPSVDSGHKLGMATIIDANMTTLIAAIFIFQFGTGPVRGFALNLTLGILGAFYGSIFASKLIMDFLVKRRIFSI